MSSDSPTPPSNPAPKTLPSWSWLLPSGIVLAVYYFLFLAVPYSEGYLGGRQSVLRTAFAFWNGYEDWQHGMLVPFIVAFIVWMQRETLAAIPIRGSNWGLPVMGLALATYWLGYVVDHHYIGFVSAQILVAGLIIWYLGFEMMKAVLFPWAFLAFMWPFLFLDNVLAFPLRMTLSDFAFHFLNSIGIPSLKIGSAVVSAPDPTFHVAAAKRFAIDIADPCSGIRSLFALGMVSALYAHFAVEGFWKKIVVAAAAIPFAILGNFARILLLVFGTIIFGSDFAIGDAEHPSTYHMAAGFFVFVVALSAMILLGKLLAIDWLTIPAIWRKTILRKPTPTRSPASPTGQNIEPVQDLY